jgi:hypothetical protein
MYQPPNQAGEVIAVQVADKDRRNFIWINALTCKADKGRGAAIDQELAAGMGGMKAGLQPPPDPKASLDPMIVSFMRSYLGTERE